MTAPAPPQVLSRSAAGASVLAHVVVSKFADHTPLHRLHRIYSRSGADIPVSTLADWVAGVGALAELLVERLDARVLEAHIVPTDATGLKVLDPRSVEHIEVGSIWASRLIQPARNCRTSRCSSTISTKDIASRRSHVRRRLRPFTNRFRCRAAGSARSTLWCGFRVRISGSGCTSIGRRVRRARSS